MTGRFFIAVSSALIFGCNTAPHKYPPPAQTGDASIGQDSGTQDAGRAPSCMRGDTTCPTGQYCAPDDICKPIPTICTITSSCAPSDVCNGGVCKHPPHGCTQKSDCAPIETCTAFGICAPAFSDNGLLETRCDSSQDCGPAGFCKQPGNCTKCTTDSDCSQHLLCSTSDGKCVERSPCMSDFDCFLGNHCTQGACKRSVLSCSQADGNDSVGQAIALDETYYQSRLDICGDDLDFYSIALNATTAAARIVVTTTRAIGTVDAALVDEIGDPLPDVAKLVLPGFVALGYAPDGVRSKIYLRVEGNDVSVPYSIDVRRDKFSCGADEFDMYGDTDRTTAPIVPPDAIFHLRACTGDQDWLRTRLNPGDRVKISATYSGDANLGLDLFDQHGLKIQARTTTTARSDTIENATTFATTQTVALNVTNQGVASAGDPYALILNRATDARTTECMNPHRLTITESGSGRVTGTLAGGQDLSAPFCPESAPPLRNDAIYEVRLPANSSPAELFLSARQTNAPSTSLVSLALLSDCKTDTATIACALSIAPLHDASIQVRVDRTDPIFVVVSSDHIRDAVDFEIDARLEHITPPPNDACPNATDLGSASTTTIASTYGARDDIETSAQSCGALSGEGAGPDRFYRLSLSAGERAAIELNGPIGTSSFLWVTADGNCTNLTTTCTVADSSSGLPGARALLMPKAAAHYYVIVDGETAADVADWQLRVVRQPDLECFADSECTPPSRCDDYKCKAPPLNDRCPGAGVRIVNGHATIHGSTGAAKDDFFLTCALLASQGEPDVVYNVDVPVGATSLRAHITAANWDPLIGIVQAKMPVPCDGPEVACDDDVGPNSEDLLPDIQIPNPMPGMYFIIVDGYSGSGPFTLDIDITP